MKLKLIETKIVSIDLKAIENGEKKFKLSFINDYKDDNKFSVSFDLSLEHPNFNLATKAIYWFECDESITAEFKNSDFPKINAPAIAFPFLRAFISFLTLQAGYTAVMLPSINFVEFGKPKAKKIGDKERKAKKSTVTQAVKSNKTKK